MLVLKTIIALIVFALGLFSYLEGISQLHKKEIKSNEYQVWFYQLEINLKKRFPGQDGRLNLLNKVTVVLNFLLIISLGIFVSGIYIINKTPDVSLIIWGMWSGLILMIMSLIFRNRYYRLYKKTIDCYLNSTFDENISISSYLKVLFQNLIGRQTMFASGILIVGALLFISNTSTVKAESINDYQ